MSGWLGVILAALLALAIGAAPTFAQTAPPAGDPPPDDPGAAAVDEPAGDSSESPPTGADGEEDGEEDGDGDGPPPDADERPGTDAALAAAGLDETAIKTRIETLSGVAEPSEAQKAELAALRDSIKFIGQARASRVKADEWTAKVEAAPKDLETLEATPAPTPATEPAPTTPLEALEKQLKAVESDLSAARDSRDQLDRTSQERSTRRKDIPEQLAAAQRRVGELDQTISDLPPAASGDPSAAARRWRAVAERAATRAQIDALKAEQAGIDARAPLLTKRREQAVRLVDVLTADQKLLRPIVEQKRADAAAELQRQARAAAADAARQEPAVAALLERNVQLAEELAEVSALESKATDRLALSTRLLDTISRWYARDRERINAVGLDSVTADLMRRHLAELPEDRALERTLQEIQQETGAADLRRIELDDEIQELLSTTNEVEEALETLPPDSSPERIEAVRKAVEAALEDRRRNFVEPLDTVLQKLTTTLGKLDITTRETIAEVVEYRDYIEERILWVRSGPPLTPSTLRQAAGALGTIISPASWTGIASALATDLTSNPVGFIPVAVVGLLAILRPRARRAIHEAGEKVSRASTDRAGYTGITLLLTVALAVQWPLFIWMLAARLVAMDAHGGPIGTLGIALQQTAPTLFYVTAIVQALRPGGLAAAHFRVPARPLKLARRIFRTLLWLVVPVVLVSRFGQGMPKDSDFAMLGRVAFVVGMLITTGVHLILMHPTRGVFAEWYADHRESITTRLRFVWLALLSGVPAVLALLSTLGFHYTATQIQLRMSMTWLLAIGYLLVTGVMIRWLTLNQRRLALASLQRSQEDIEKDAASEGEDSFERLAKVSVRTRRLLNSALILGLIGGLYAIWSSALPALNFLDRFELWSQVVPQPDGSFETVPITLSNLVLALFALLVFLFAVRNLPGLIEFAILSRLPISASGRYAATTLTSYSIVVIGVVVIAGMLGIGWGQVQWLAAAVSVGLGFGLKEIFENFVSGLVILFERPVRVGDVVSVGETTGTVSRVRIRATTITDWDNKELLVPNREIITGRVVNWSLSESRVRIVLEVGIAYGSDTGLAQRLLLEAARSEQRVLRDPEPVAVFTGFGDNALNFSLRVHVPIDCMLGVRNELNFIIDRMFREAGIEISFPQRDLHVRGPVEVVIPERPVKAEPEAMPSEPVQTELDVGDDE